MNTQASFTIGMAAILRKMHLLCRTSVKLLNWEKTGLTVIYKSYHPTRWNLRRVFRYFVYGRSRVNELAIGSYTCQVKKE